MPADKDVKPLDPPVDATETQRLPAGRIIHDDRGNAVWKWIGDTSNSGTGSGILKHLDASDLKVEGQSSPVAPARGSPSGGCDPTAGYDPYNQTPPKSGAVPVRKSSGTKR